MKVALVAVSFFYCSVASAQIAFDQHPVSNKAWSVFLQFIKNDPALSKKYGQSMAPDQWKPAQTTFKWQDAPVIGISWQQASAYCEWRSVTATYLHTHSKATTYQAMQIANAAAKTLITYRLPSEAEYKKSAKRFTDEPRKGIGFRCVHSIRKIA